jgi:cytochrome c
LSQLFETSGRQEVKAPMADESGAERVGLAAKAVAVLLVCGLALASCDSRARAVKAGLSANEVALFEAGQRVSTDCWSCHDFYAKNNKVGPHLVGIVGRPAAAVGSFSYSPAMQRAGLAWDEEALRAFLADPAGRVPGTTMLSRGVSRGTSMDALIFYMVQLYRSE